MCGKRISQRLGSTGRLSNTEHIHKTPRNPLSSWPTFIWNSFIHSAGVWDFSHLWDSFFQLFCKELYWHRHMHPNPSISYTSKTECGPLKNFQPSLGQCMDTIPLQIRLSWFSEVNQSKTRFKTGATEKVWCTSALLHGGEQQCLCAECSLICTEPRLAPLYPFI